MNKDSSEVLKKIKVIAMDVDGVLTDGIMHFGPRGHEMKNFHALDGLGIVLAKRAGLKVAFISARRSKALSLRAKELGVDALYQNRMEKVEAFQDLLKKLKIKADEVCFIGDDLIDIPILKRVGFPVAVSNGVFEVKKYAKYITSASGGRGAVREVIEEIMKAQGIWDREVKKYEEL